MSKQSKTATGPRKNNKKAQAIINLAYCMLPGGVPTMPPFGRTFAVIEDIKGVRVPIEIKNNTAKHVHIETLYHAAFSYYYNNFLSTGQGTTLLPADIKQAVASFISLSIPLDSKKIKIVAQNSDKNLCWNRLPFDVVAGDCPVFDEMMERTTNKRAVMAWIGSLFDPNADTQQYIWLHGAGRNGKGRLMYFLSRIFGDGYAPEIVPKGERRFWTSALLGKRLVVFSDCDDPYFPQTGFFKSLSGGDPQRVEFKGGSIIMAELQAKFVFLSNDPPKIRDTEAETRRAIYAQMMPITGNLVATKEYNEKLWEEAPAILEKCLDAYRKETKGQHGIIPTAAENVQEIIEDTEETWQSFAEQYLEFGEECSMAGSDLYDILVREKNYFPKKQDRDDFITWLKRQPGVLKKRPRKEKGITRPRVWLGVKLNGLTRDARNV